MGKHWRPQGLGLEMGVSYRNGVHLCQGSGELWKEARELMVARGPQPVRAKLLPSAPPGCCLCLVPLWGGY